MPPPKQITRRRRLSASSIDDRTQYNHSPPQVPNQSHRVPSQPTHTFSAASSTINALVSICPPTPPPVDLQPPQPAHAFAATAPPSLLTSQFTNHSSRAPLQPPRTPPPPPPLADVSLRSTVQPSTDHHPTPPFHLLATTVPPTPFPLLPSSRPTTFWSDNPPTPSSPVPRPPPLTPQLSRPSRQQTAASPRPRPPPPATAATPPSHPPSPTTTLLAT